MMLHNSIIPYIYSPLEPPSMKIEDLPKGFDLYVLGHKLSKRDKLGMHSFVEKVCIEILSLAIESALKPKLAKKESLELLRIKTGLLQNLIRTENELGIIEQKSYFLLSSQIIEISKMANGWLNYINKKEAG